MHRRNFLSVASAGALGAAETKPKLLLPSDQPDELGFRLMWFSPTAPIDQQTYRLTIGGLVDKPLALSLTGLRRFPHEEQSSRLKCVQCWSSRTTWGGFRFGHLLEMAKPRKSATAVRIDCADKWYVYMSVKDMLDPRVLLAMEMAGKPLSDQHGAPLRIIDPSRYGYKSAKLVTSITFVEQ